MCFQFLVISSGFQIDLHGLLRMPTELTSECVYYGPQEKCDSIFRDLLKSGYPCLSLHGGKDQSDRESTIADFKGNVCNVLIATSVAARGYVPCLL